METVENLSNMTTFILLGFGNLLELHIPLFILFLGFYMLSMLGNLLIVFLVAVDQHLHTPMYFFLLNLSCVETCYVSTILPRMLDSFLTRHRNISIIGCLTQYYFFGSCGAIECYLLAIMSYDRYLAICRPLHYTCLMSGRLCIQLIFTSWICGLVTCTIITALMFTLTFCGPNEIDHYFCDLYPVINLSCSNTYHVKQATFLLAFIAIAPPFLLTLASYVCIIMTVLRIKCKTTRQKVFSTCSSHLVVVTCFYMPLFIVYVVPETDTLKVLHKTFSLFYTVLTPILNPLIYSLRNREVKEAFFRFAKKFSN